MIAVVRGDADGHAAIGSAAPLDSTRINPAASVTIEKKANRIVSPGVISRPAREVCSETALLWVKSSVALPAKEGRSLKRPTTAPSSGQQKNDSKRGSV